jgi:SAM-dependent methyltransferase
VQTLASATNVPNNPDIRSLVAAALTEPWARPASLADAAIRLVKANTVVANSIARINDPATKEITAASLFGAFGLTVLARDELLRALLQSTPICDPQLERLLTTLRFLLLQAAGEPKPLDPDLVALYSALAKQCYINDYVFAVSPIEEELVSRACAAVANAVNAGVAIYPLVPVAIAAYRPLHTLPSAEQLLRTPVPMPIAAVFDQQIREPVEEQKIRAALPKLTPIVDEISEQVQRQYESNPYPTWVKLGPVGNAKRIFAAVLERFLETDGDRNRLQILVAGSGTGQHSIETALSYPDGAQVLAIDLSSASLAYAVRKTREAGVTNIEYAQADILKLGSIDRSFDVIESSGVLHHLGDPLEGWRVLNSLLRPGGLMRLGFYSKRARRHINAMRDLISKGGYQPTPDGIRLARQTIIARAATDEAAAWIARSPDFYSVSACRDLLFHVQEHQFTIPQIGDFLAANDLQFIAFDVIQPQIREAYRQKFPQDPTATDLKCWDEFEAEHPHLFGGMYQFWIKKPR